MEEQFNKFVIDKMDDQLYKLAMDQNLYKLTIYLTPSQWQEMSKWSASGKKWEHLSQENACPIEVENMMKKINDDLAELIAAKSYKYDPETMEIWPVKDKQDDTNDTCM